MNQSNDASVASPARWRRPLLMALVTAVVFAADAMATAMVRANLTLGEQREVIPQLLTLTHIRNSGAVYGLLTGQRWLLVATSAVILLATPLLLRAFPRVGVWVWAGPLLIGLLLGGALGNLLERTRDGYVTDFLEVPVMPLFQVFNLSDVGITLAVVGLISLSLTGAGRETPMPSSTCHQSNGAAP